MPPAEPYEPPKINHEIFVDLPKIECAIRMVLSNDNYLLLNSGSERSIAHKLAQYLQAHDKDLDVDCEYNLTINNDRGRKAIQFLEEKYVELSIPRHGRRFQKESGEILIEISVSPDIIIHKRGDNSKNTAIIEVKKQGSDLNEFDFDKTKLAFYTGDSCEFKYPQGYLINLPHGKWISNDVEIFLFTNGDLVSTQRLRNNHL